MHKKFIFSDLFIIMFVYVFCFFYQSIHCDTNKFIYRENTHQQSIAQIFCYQIYGNIMCIFNTQKIFGRFVWNQYNKINYNVKFFDIFGFTIMSIYVNNGVISIPNNNVMRQNNNIGLEIKKWFIANQFFLEQLQKWIIGSPGENTKYDVNSSGYLSYVHCNFNDESVFIYYRSYYYNNNPVLPKILEIYYGKYYFKLIINRWNI